MEFCQPPTERFYGIEALMKDNSGNWFSLTQPEGASKAMDGATHIEKLRAWWSHRQGLDGRLAGKTAGRGSAAKRAGLARWAAWGRILTLFSRAGTSREAADGAVAKLEIHELPAARGCTYVVPACDFALALQGRRSIGDGDMKVAYKLGVTDKEIDKLCEAVLECPGEGAAGPGGDPRRPPGKARASLGEEGKKKGITTTLPLALGMLQTAGEIRRVPVNGRLDQQRYRLHIVAPEPARQEFKIVA